MLKNNKEKMFWKYISFLWPKYTWKTLVKLFYINKIVYWLPIIKCINIIIIHKHACFELVVNVIIKIINSGLVSRWIDNNRKSPNFFKNYRKNHKNYVKNRKKIKIKISYIVVIIYVIDVYYVYGSLKQILSYGKSSSIIL